MDIQAARLGHVVSPWKSRRQKIDVLNRERGWTTSQSTILSIGVTLVERDHPGSEEHKTCDSSPYTEYDQGWGQELVTRAQSRVPFAVLTGPDGVRRRYMDSSLPSISRRVACNYGNVLVRVTKVTKSVCKFFFEGLSGATWQWQWQLPANATFKKHWSRVSRPTVSVSNILKTPSSFTKERWGQ